MAQDIEFGVTHDGLDELIRDIMAAGDVPDEVQKNMVRAKAKIVEEAEVYTAGTMLVGPYYKGGVARSVTAKKPVMRKNGAQVDIVFKGTQHGNRLGEIAFVNEHGKKSQPARPFIKRALEISKDAATAAAYKEMLVWLKDHNL